MTSFSNKNYSCSILAYGILLVVFVVVAVGASRLDLAPDVPRFAGLWEFKGFLIVVTTGMLCILTALVIGVDGPRRRRRAFGFLAGFLALCVVIALLEISAALRIVDYRLVWVTHFTRPREHPRNILDAELLYRHPPHEHFVGNVRGDLTMGYGSRTDRHYAVDFRYDHRGFRNHEDRELAEVVLIGDSMVEGSLVPYEQITSSRLEDLLQVPVLNLGQVGYGPQQCAIVLRRFGLPARPQVVVWMLFEGNDLTLDFKRYQRSIVDFEGYVRETHGFKARSFTRNFFLAVAHWSPWQTDEYMERARNRSCVLNNGSAAGERLYFAYRPLELTPEVRTQLHGPLHSVLEGHRACEAAGVQFLVVLIPIKYRVYHDVCTIEPGTEVDGWTLHDVPGFVADWARAHNIDFIDLTPDLRSSAIADNLVYHLDDSHWASPGHEVAAERIAQLIRERQWLRGLKR